MPSSIAVPESVDDLLAGAQEVPNGVIPKTNGAASKDLVVEEDHTEVNGVRVVGI